MFHLDAIPQAPRLGDRGGRQLRHAIILSFILWAFNSISTPAAKGVAFSSPGFLSDRNLTGNKGTELTLLRSQTGSQQKPEKIALCPPLLRAARGSNSSWVTALYQQFGDRQARA